MYDSSHFTLNDSESQRPSCHLCHGRPSADCQCFKGLDASFTYQESFTSDSSDLKLSDTFRQSEIGSPKSQSSYKPRGFTGRKPMMNNSILSIDDLFGASALDTYNSQNLSKLKEIQEMITNKATELKKSMNDLENYVSGQDEMSQALQVKQDTLIEEVDSFFQNLDRILKDQREAIKNNIQKKFSAIYIDNISDKEHALEWISNLKVLLNDIDNKTTDNTSILYGLWKQEESYKKLNVNKLKRYSDIKNSLNQIQFQHNNQILDILTKINILEIKSNLSDDQGQAPSSPESIRESISDNNLQQERAQRPEQQSQNSPSIKAPLSAYQRIQNNFSTNLTTTQKIEVPQEFENASKSQPEVQVIPQQDPYTYLELILKNNSHIGIFEKDKGVEFFRRFKKEDQLQELWKKVSCLNLHCSNLTRIGVESLFKAISLPNSFQAINLSFETETGEGFYPIDTKDLFLEIPKLMSLKELSLKFPGWKCLSCNAFIPLVFNVSKNKNLKSLVLDFTGCWQLDIAAVSKALLGGPLQHKTLEKLFICFKNCPKLENGRNNELEYILEKCRTSALKEIQLDFTDCSKIQMRGPGWVTSTGGKIFEHSKNLI